ncbi:hypothetical protein PAMP_015370 [Pampus punctatissimus]
MMMESGPMMQVTIRTHYDTAELIFPCVFPAGRASWLHTGSLCEMAVDTQSV